MEIEYDEYGNPKKKPEAAPPPPPPPPVAPSPPLNFSSFPDLSNVGGAAGYGQPATEAFLGVPSSQWDPALSGAPGAINANPSSSPPPPISGMPRPSAPTALPQISRTTNVPTVQVGQAARTELAPPPTVNAPVTQYAGRTTARAVSGSSEGQALQREAANSIRGVLAGTQPSVAQLQQREGFDRASAEQLSIAAGARGRNVAAANRIASSNIAQIHQQSNAEQAKLRAQEQATGRGEAAGLGTAVRGQDIDVSRTNAENSLKAGLASDDRLQGVLSERSRLKLAADQGDQGAAVQLQALQGTLDGEMQRFNATQLQNASAADAENYLKGVGLDDSYVTAVKNQWLQLQQLGQTERLELLKTQVLLEIAHVQHDQGWWEKYGPLIGGLALGAGGIAAGILTANPAVAAAGIGAGSAVASSGAK